MGPLMKYMFKETGVYLICSLILGLLIFCAYSNSFYSPLVLDDFHSFVEEPKVHVSLLDYESLRELTKTKFGISRFIPMLTFALDLKLGKGNIGTFHLTNLVIHFLVASALFLFLSTLFDSQELNPYLDGRRRFPSPILPFLITGLWALNPVQTNAVTYLVQRMTSLAALFYLLSLGFYLSARWKHREKGLNRTVAVYYSLFSITFLLALICKQNTATLPMVILLLEVVFINPDLLKRVLKNERLLAFICLFALAMVFGVFYSLFPNVLDGYSHRHFTLSQRLLTELRVLVSYIFLLLLPLPRFMNLEHDVTVSSSLFSPITTLLSLLLLVLIVGVGWKIRKKYPLISLGIFWFFLNLLVESTILPLELKFEHRLYLPSVGFYLTLVVIGFIFVKNISILNKIRTPHFAAIVLCFVLFSIFSLLTYKRNMDWQDSVTLYQDCVKKAPMKARNHSNLAKAYVEAGKYDKAIKEAEIAISLGKKGYEEYWVATCNIVASLIAKKHFEQAIKRGEQLLNHAPADAKKGAYPFFLANLGTAYRYEKRYDLAYDTFYNGLKYLKFCDSLYMLMLEMKMLGLVREISQNDENLAKELLIDGDDAACIDGKMADIFFSLRDYDRAMKYCQKGLSKNPGSSECIKIKQNMEDIGVGNNLKAKASLNPLVWKVEANFIT
jgi:tetratricopeptide (TPR) repeat protein